MPGATVTPMRGQPAPTPKPQPSAHDILDEAAAKLAEWAKLCPDGSHIRSDATPDTPADLSFWANVEDTFAVQLKDAFVAELDSVGGPVPPFFGNRDLGARP